MTERSDLDSIEMLKQQASTGDPEIRIHAIQQFGEFDTEEAVETLIKIADGDTINKEGETVEQRDNAHSHFDLKDQLTAVAVLGDINNPKAASFILELCQPRGFWHLDSSTPVVTERDLGGLTNNLVWSGSVDVRFPRAKGALARELTYTVRSTRGDESVDGTEDIIDISHALNLEIEACRLIQTAYYKAMSREK